MKDYALVERVSVWVPWWAWVYPTDIKQDIHRLYREKTKLTIKDTKYLHAKLLTSLEVLKKSCKSYIISQKHKRVKIPVTLLFVINSAVARQIQGWSRGLSRGGDCPENPGEGGTIFTCPEIPKRGFFHFSRFFDQILTQIQRKSNFFSKRIKGNWYLRSFIGHEIFSLSIQFTFLGILLLTLLLVTRKKSTLQLKFL